MTPVLPVSPPTPAGRDWYPQPDLAISRGAVRLLGQVALLLAFGVTSAQAQQSSTLQTAAGGATVSGSNPSWTSGFGNVNGLGLGTPGTGISVLTAGLTGGVLYTTPLNVVVVANGGTAATIRAYVSGNFSHPSALDLRLCYPAASCTTAAGFASLSTVAGSPSLLVQNVGSGTYTAALGLYVGATNGSGAFAGIDSATISVLTYQANNGQLRDTDTLTLSSPSTNLQTALHLLLESAGGAPVSSGSSPAVSFGTVNGLGIGPAAGLTVATSSDGALYRTPYAVTTTFSGFASTTATLRAHVGTDFAHPAVLELRDSSDNTTFAALSKSSVAPTTLSAVVASGGAVTRHLGLFVSGINGAGAFSGADSAVVTFTVVVP